jgi:AhpD family alkylhydroperoxidase
MPEARPDVRRPSHPAPATPPTAPMAGHPARGPRLAPLERARSFWVRLFALLLRWQLGKVMTPVTVIYARMPRLLWPQMRMVRLAQTGLSLDPTLVDLVQVRASVANGCSFCTDLHRAMAMRAGRDPEKLRAATDVSHPGSGLSGLTGPERAALALASEMGLGGVPSDATFAALRATFDERAVVELVWLCAFTGYLTSLARGFGIESDGFCEAVSAKRAS